jgi:hypothetical protein
MRRACALVTAVVTLLTAATAHADDGVHPYVGSLHEHSAYSDGWPGSRPAEFYSSGARHGLDFMGGSDHSDNTGVPMSFSDYCANPQNPQYDPTQPGCAVADATNPSDSFRKWDATGEQAAAATTPTFTAFRGFEWTSDRFGHINVYFSSRWINAKADGGYATMDSFYSWLTRPTALGGGSDGLATFNHPGDKKLSTSDPAYNWNDFAYVPAADDQMVGIETYNSASDFARPRAHGGPAEGWYSHALDKGWHVGAIGAEDLGHHYSDDWGGPGQAKTVVLATDRSAAALQVALRDRRFYAIARPAYRLSYTVDDAPMGSRLERRAGDRLRFSARATGAADGPPVALELVTSGGKVAATGGDGRLVASLRWQPAAKWFFVRALQGGQVIAYSSPVWVTAADHPGQWLAGDLHVHTCYSHDVFCGPLDEPFQIEPGDDPADLAAGEVQYVSDPDNLQQIYAYGVPAGIRFQEAALRGLDYLAITDHNDVRSERDRGFGAAGVLGIPGYENSIRGHAQMLGATHLYDNGDQSAKAINTEESALHAAGGVFQANHPGYRIASPFTSCADTKGLHWQYGYEVRPDTIEVWNPTSPILDAEAYLECWLQRGDHMGITGGSDDHWADNQGLIGVGDPTTWIFARSRTRADLLAALRAGRTSVSRYAPAQGGAPLLLEADPKRNGSFTAIVGDKVTPGTAMRVRSAASAASGLVTVRANGHTLVDEQPLQPGSEIDFRAPNQPGWVRATLMAAPSSSSSAPTCQQESYGPVSTGGQSISTCAYDALMLGMTSPIYLG